MKSALVLDDQPAICLALELLLELHGWQIGVTTTPAEALTQLERSSFDVIIQDLNLLPGEQDGRSGLKMIADVHTRWPAMPIVVVTALTKEELRERCLLAGASIVLTKPWDDQQLLHCLSRLTTRSA
jgi:CheY-like chemotaxis protein